jgi:hypothetical protein
MVAAANLKVEVAVVVALVVVERLEVVAVVEQLGMRVGNRAVRGRAAAVAPLRRAAGSCCCTRINGGHVSRPWRHGPPQCVFVRVQVALDEIVCNRR